MGTSLKVTICFVTAAVSLLDMTGSMERSSSDCVNLAVTQRARQGGSATIKCKYPAEENSVKKFCRENENSQCANLISSYMANYTIRGRLSLTDNKEQQEFTVTISTLTQDDAGTYQCAMTRINSNSSVCLTEVNLDILPDRDIKTKKLQNTIIHPTTTGNRSGNPPKIGLISGILGCLVLLVVGLLAIVILLVEQKIPCPPACCAEGGSLEVVTNNTEGNRDNDYEEIQISSRNQQADSRDVQSVYAADNQLHYSSIVCQRDSVTVSTDGDVLPDVTTTGSLACDYSCINSTTYPPTAKKTVSSAAEMPGEP